jgi:hypothetical protein
MLLLYMHIRRYFNKICDKEQYFVLNITVYGRMCLFTILMLNVCGVIICYGNTMNSNTIDKQVTIFRIK